MTESDFYKKYVDNKFTLKFGPSRDRGHQDSITETSVEILDKKTNEVVAKVKRTEVNERGREPTIFWEE
ncbi:hypothetical protein H9Q89_15855 [Enterobacter cloacae]|uniref:hypothetical protein n=1 Tax=Enterobacter cloacae TaxID=550 RepID=UPI001650212C|nr:hypothetical protein [Enterobacter cloacae]HDC4470124.1 hypothetical protein [Enterobacter kobei]MBC6339660.1 hypothetical protein [Enterobacter cloacae]MCK1073273.1 hypothetical protein [Enterobacter cloacae subsp. cloacae]MCZ9581916.1 hypothetical protein [Enterobacter cloacae]HAS1224557.1 hypothetical protein [Enterobacter cloacae]